MQVRMQTERADADAEIARLKEELAAERARPVARSASTESTADDADGPRRREAPARVPSRSPGAASRGLRLEERMRGVRTGPTRYSAGDSLLRPAREMAAAERASRDTPRMASREPRNSRRSLGR